MPLPSLFSPSNQDSESLPVYSLIRLVEEYPNYRPTLLSTLPTLPFNMTDLQVNLVDPVGVEAPSAHKTIHLPPLLWYT